MAKQTKKAEKETVTVKILEQQDVAGKWYLIDQEYEVSKDTARLWTSKGKAILVK